MSTNTSQTPGFVSSYRRLFLVGQCRIREVISYESHVFSGLACIPSGLLVSSNEFYVARAFEKYFGH